MHASTQERELTLFNKPIKWTAQAVANLYAELVGPPYSLEGREGMNKGQFQQLMHQLKVPMPRTGPFSSSMNNRLFNMFDRRTKARVTLEDMLHGLNVLSGDGKKDKLMMAFRAFDLNSKGVITLNEMIAAIKDITNMLYVGQKIPTPERVKVFAAGVMIQYNEDKDEAQYVLTTDQFIESAMATAQIANLFALGAIPATSDEADEAESSEEVENAETPARRPSGTDNIKPKSTPPISGEAGRGAGRGGAGAGRGGVPVTSSAKGGLGRGNIGQHSQPPPHATSHHEATSINPSSRTAASENRERRKSAGDKEAAARDTRERRKSDNKASAVAGPAGAAQISPRGRKPEERKNVENPSVKREVEPDEREVEPQETAEEMNVRLVAHIRALQSELRKYMDVDKDNKQELEKLRSQVKDLTAENTQLKKKLQKTSQESKQLVLEKEKEKGEKEKALARRVGEMQTEIAKQRDTEKYNVPVMAATRQYLVGPPVERGLASNLQELRITKTGYMMKRGDLIKNWKKRIFILRDNMQLIYYSPEERPTPRGVLDLRTVVLIRVPKDAPPNVIEIVTSSRQWFLACDTEEDAQEWTKVLNHLVETNKLRPAVGADRYMPPTRT